MWPLVISSLLLILLLVLGTTTVDAQISQAFLNEPFEVQVTGYSTISCVSSLSERANTSMFAVEGTPTQYFSTSTSLNITFLFSGTMNLTINNVVQSIVVIPRTIQIGSVFSDVYDAAFELATYVTIQHINTYLTDILPNTTLLFNPIHSSATCASSTGIGEARDLLSSPEPPVAIFGPFCYTPLTTLSIVTGTKQVPLIAVDAPQNLNSVDFPYLISMQPYTYERLTTVMIDFMIRMGYSRIVVVEQDNSILESSFFDDANQAGIDVTQRILLRSGETEYGPILDKIRKSGARVIFCSIEDSSFNVTEGLFLWTEAYNQGMYGNDTGYVWISDVASGVLSDYSNGLFNGLLTISLNENFLFPEARQNWSAIWNEIVTVWTPETDYYYNLYQDSLSIEDGTPYDTWLAYNCGTCGSYNGVLMLAHVLHNFIYVEQIEYTGAMLIEALRQVDFDGACGRIKFYPNGQFDYGVYIASIEYDLSIQETVFPSIQINESAPVIPMSVNLTGTFLNGASYVGQWIPDFVCDGGCGHGVCLGPNDCQCLNEFQQSPNSNSCDENFVLYDDSITVYLSASLYLMTRLYERFVAENIASALNVSVNQIKTIQYSGNQTVATFQFVTFADISLTNIILESDLGIVLSQLSNIQGLSPLSMELNIVRKDWIRFDEPVGIVFSTSTILLGVTLLAAIILPFLKKNSPSMQAIIAKETNQKPLSWLANGAAYIGVFFAIGTFVVQIGQPTNATCRIRPWFLFLSLTLVGSVKFVHLWRLYHIFENPNYSKVLSRFNDDRILVLLITLSTILFLIIGEIQKPTSVILETTANINRDRAWVCVNGSFLNDLSMILLISFHLILSLSSATLRYLVRHVPTAYMNHELVDATYFVGVPLIFSSLWITAMTNDLWVSRVSAIVATSWVQIYSFLYLCTELHSQFKRLTNTKTLAHTETVQTFKAPPNSVSSAIKNIWIELSVPRIKCTASLANDDWNSYLIKFLTIRNNLVIGLFPSSKNETALLFSASNICRVAEINEKNHLLRLFTNNHIICTIQLKDSETYNLVLQILTSMVSGHEKPVSTSSALSKKTSVRKPVSTKSK